VGEMVEAVADASRVPWLDDAVNEAVDRSGRPAAAAASLEATRNVSGVMQAVVWGSD
jgi:hypothetical protein